MERLIVLLRAVNVGNRQLAMAELRALADRLGYRDPTTYLASGNLVVTADRVAIERGLPPALERRFGFPVELVVRGAAELAAALDHDPFADAAAREPNRVWLFFSQAPQPADAATRLAERAGAGEHLAQDANAVWLHAEAGIGASRITPAFIDKVCGSPTTARNVRTVRALIDLAA